MSDAARSPLLTSLLAALARSPEDVALRLHVADLLLGAGDPAAALQHCAHVLRAEPANGDAVALLSRVTDALSGEHPLGAGTSPGKPGPAVTEPEASTVPFNWDEAERQMSEPAGAGGAATSHDHRSEADDHPGVHLDDVGGMDAVKEEIRAAFLLPMLRPDLRSTYGAISGGGLLLYGPPGCGKTFVARALAGELGAGFTVVSLADVLDMWLGSSEKNVQTLFSQARQRRPTVVFLDEVDAIGQKRSNLRHSPAMRGTVNQLLFEMDGASHSNEGVFVLAATNQPWDVDPALRRPGRLDRTIFVPPPDGVAREAILRYHLRDRPLGTIDVGRLSRKAEGYSGADLTRVCTLATRQALASAAATQTIEPITMGHLEDALRQVRPSTSEWFATARHAASFANQDGTYDDLIAYARARKLW